MKENTIKDIFGSKVFSDEVMSKCLPHEIYDELKAKIALGHPLTLEIANAVAEQMKNWALSNGATHYTHWFQPLTGVTAEKHDGFIDINKNGEMILKFNGKCLIKGEPDASSFPSGGLRATFEARGYTAWDPTSPAFVKDNTLYIPTAFCSFSGEALDKKTPLLRSMEYIDCQAKKILSLFGKNVSKVNATVGAEQEYFLIDKSQYEKRIDLVSCGTTLFGAKPSKGQELDDHYFGKIKERVKAFMAELDKELWELGILAKTEHNEVAPSQHEIAPIFTNCNIETDHNQLTMAIMKSVANKFDMVCLLHEKPFEGVNGSGKHDNWSLCTSDGENLLEPSDNPAENKQFMLFLSAVIQAVDDHQDLLRISVASASNDHRLGANEAPPAIVSMYIGEELENALSSYAGGNGFVKHKASPLNTGVSVISQFEKDKTDRNRTSPFAFTGNKFEFRMLGSMQSIAGPNTVLNTIVAESLEKFYDRLSKATDFDSELSKIIGETYAKHSRIIFNGNNYSDEWVKEAESRGLCNYKTTVDAVKHLTDEKNINLFTSHGVFTKSELMARKEIMLEEYSKIISIECDTMLEMANKLIIPAILEFKGKVAKNVLSLKELKFNATLETNLLEKLEIFSEELFSSNEKLKKVFEKLSKTVETVKKADLCKMEVLPKMKALRNVCDNLECIVDKKCWPIPDYSDLLYSVKY